MTHLQETLKRLLTINGRDYVIARSPDGLKLPPKGKRRGGELQWEAKRQSCFTCQRLYQTTHYLMHGSVTQEPSDKQLAESTEHGKKTRAVETTTGKR
jgi:hypothetical protein